MNAPGRAVRAALAAAVTGAAGTAFAVAVRADSCDQACQVAWAWEAQHRNALPRTTLYDAPHPLRPASLGALIKQERTSAYVVEGRPVRGVRVLYHSRTSAGRDIAASGVVLLPPGVKHPKVVVDAHGSSGIGAACAPSLMRDLYHGNQMTRFLERGYAVVAPDYAGLGTDGRPEFVNKTAEAADIVGALRSARQAVPGLSRDWVLWGHSQGGGAALGFAERQVSRPEPGYLGAVVTSPATDLTALVDHLDATSPYGGFVPLIAQGAAFSDPSIRLRKLLTPAALDRIGTTRTGCLNVALAVYSDLTGERLTRPGYLTDAPFSRYLARNSTGRRYVAGPVLFLQGDADTVVTRQVSDRTAAALCRTGSRIDYRVRPGLEHDTWGGATGIDDGAMPEILAWIGDRFAGGTAGTAHTCGSPAPERQGVSR